jgi:uncharacterized protein YdaU (DUF1376 family)
MNYFEHHIGDYAEATAHLTFVEDAAYSRMIRKYYAQEKPLPVDVKAVQRLVGARSKEEREAVATVLEEFFLLADDGWHNSRCDAEIARFREGEPEREAKKANEDNRLKRHREERARLFKALTDNGLHAPWNISMGELRAMVKALPDTGPDTPFSPLPATAPATPATATQSPITTTQVNISNPESSSQASNEVGAGLRDDDQEAWPERHEEIATLLRSHGIEPGSAGLVTLTAWAAIPVVTDSVLTAAIAKARKAKPGEDIPLKYLAKTITTVLDEQAAPAPVVIPRGAPAHPTQQSLSNRKPQGNEPKGTDESYDEWQARVDAFEAARRRGQAA